MTVVNLLGFGIGMLWDYATVVFVMSLFKNMRVCQTRMFHTDSKLIILKVN